LLVDVQVVDGQNQRARGQPFQDLAEAQALCAQALATDCKVLGEDHPALVALLEGYDDVLAQAGKKAEAERLREKARDMRGRDNKD
jgi:hypothetical protein